MFKKINLILALVLNSSQTFFNISQSSEVESQDNFVFTVKRKKIDYRTRGFRLGALLAGSVCGLGTLLLTIPTFEMQIISFISLICFSPVIMSFAGILLLDDIKHSIYDYFYPKEPAYVSINKDHFSKK